MKKINIHVKRIISVMAVAAIFALIWSLLNYVLTDDTRSFTRISFHEYYDQENIDVLFMGASHCQRGFVTEIADEKLKANTFNAGSASQSLDTTYFLLEKAIKDYDLDKVVVELSYNIASSDAKQEKAMTRTYIVTDYLNPSLDVYSYLLNKSTEDDYANSFLAARRNSDKIFDFEYIAELVKTKNSDAYKKYEYFINKNVEYIGKGSTVSHNVMPISELFDYEDEDYELSVDKINSEWIESVRKIIRICEENNIELVFVSSPITTFVLKQYVDYDIYIDYVKELISEESSDVRFYDFNLLKYDIWDNSNDLFYDANHLNKDGAEKFTVLLCDLLNGVTSEEEIFYKSMKESFAAREADVYGAAHYITGDLNDDYAYCRIVGNRLEEIISRVTLIKDGNEEVVKDFNDDTEFKMVKWYLGTCRIEYALKTEPENIKVIELDAKGFY